MPHVHIHGQIAWVSIGQILCRGQAGMCLDRSTNRFMQTSSDDREWFPNVHVNRWSDA